MLTDTELAAIRDENERRKELRDKATPGPWSIEGEPLFVAAGQDDTRPDLTIALVDYERADYWRPDYARCEANAEFISHARNSDPAATIDCLLTEIIELRLVLRDALQDNTPGNRVWREGVKAALEAAARAAEEPRFQKWSYEGVLTIKTDLAEYIRAIDPSTILPGIP